MRTSRVVATTFLAGLLLLCATTPTHAVPLTLAKDANNLEKRDLALELVELLLAPFKKPLKKLAEKVVGKVLPGLHLTRRSPSTHEVNIRVVVIDDLDSREPFLGSLVKLIEPAADLGVGIAKNFFDPPKGVLLRRDPADSPARKREQPADSNSNTLQTKPLVNSGANSEKRSKDVGAGDQKWGLLGSGGYSEIFTGTPTKPQPKNDPHTGSQHRRDVSEVQLDHLLKIERRTQKHNGGKPWKLSLADFGLIGGGRSGGGHWEHHGKHSKREVTTAPLDPNVKDKVIRDWAIGLIGGGGRNEIGRRAANKRDVPLERMTMRKNRAQADWPVNIGGGYEIGSKQKRGQRGGRGSKRINLSEQSSRLSKRRREVDAEQLTVKPTNVDTSAERDTLLSRCDARKRSEGSDAKLDSRCGGGLLAPLFDLLGGALTGGMEEGGTGTETGGGGEGDAPQRRALELDSPKGETPIVSRQNFPLASVGASDDVLARSIHPDWALWGSPFEIGSKRTANSEKEAQPLPVVTNQAQFGIVMGGGSEV
ncbi:hypothetical protein CBOM_01232 [Ceraceosorus bombacis]|uniref:Uncharacterized protein n=1 Tax=Ceraceosorus bombacis TaxID=401625 RepID=A0A0P1BBZ2_9BASI|nr:hypothetical protein CBOM_01232 [Ceraceosorus bombacis]